MHKELKDRPNVEELLSNIGKALNKKNYNVDGLSEDKFNSRKQR